MKEVIISVTIADENGRGPAVAGSVIMLSLSSKMLFEAIDSACSLTGNLISLAEKAYTKQKKEG